MLHKHCAKKFKALRSIDQVLSGHKGFAAGGCFKDLLNGKSVKDIDIYFRNQKDYDAAILCFDNNPIFELFYQNDNVKAYKTAEYGGISIELCHKIFGSPEEILNQFDFTITKFAYFIESINISDFPFSEGEYRNEYTAVYDDNFFEHLFLKKLVIDNEIPYPKSTFERMLRYGQYGFKPDKQTINKLYSSISKTPVAESDDEDFY